MATYKPAAHISDIRGHVQNAVYSRNRLGNYIKLRKAPLDRQTPDQLTQRTLMHGANAFWLNDMTSTDRTTWNSLGLLTTWYNKAGIAYHPSGFNLFIRMYLFCYDPTEQLVFLAPTTAAAPAPTFTITADSGATTPINLTADAAWCHLKVGYAKFSISAPTRPTVNYPVRTFITTEWQEILEIENNMPVLLYTAPASDPSDHITVIAQAFYALGYGNVVTWPQIQVLSIV